MRDNKAGDTHLYYSLRKDDQNLSFVLIIIRGRTRESCVRTEFLLTLVNRNAVLCTREIGVLLVQISMSQNLSFSV